MAIMRAANCKPENQMLGQHRYGTRTGGLTDENRQSGRPVCGCDVVFFSAKIKEAYPDSRGNGLPPWHTLVAGEPALVSGRGPPNMPAATVTRRSVHHQTQNPTTIASPSVCLWTKTLRVVTAKSMEEYEPVRRR